MENWHKVQITKIKLFYLLRLFINMRNSQNNTAKPPLSRLENQTESISPKSYEIRFPLETFKNYHIDVRH